MTTVITAAPKESSGKDGPFKKSSLALGAHDRVAADPGHVITKKKRKLEDAIEAGETEESRRQRKRLKRLAKEAKRREREPDTVEGTPVPLYDALMPESPPAGGTGTAPSKQDTKTKARKTKKDKQDKKKRNARPDDTSGSVTVTESTSLASTAVPTPVAHASPAPFASPADIAAYLTKNRITISGEVAPVLSFNQLVVPPALRTALAAFKEPTPIQACSWPALLSGRDVIGIAETGSGKTLAFGLPALSNLINNPLSGQKKGPQISVLVVAPTRELAIQTHDTLAGLGESSGIASVCLFGGMDKNEQRKALQGSRGKTVRIVAGTPGRLLDLANDGTLDLSRVSYLVLDEADRMLDKGFENDIRSIIGMTMNSGARQTLMFSATWPDSVRKLASTFLNNPVRITVGSLDLTANSRVTQEVDVFDDPRSKDQRLNALLRKLNHHQTRSAGSDESRILVFVLYKKEAVRVETYLRRLGYSVGAIHGDLGQSQRLKALDEFKNGGTGLLVATDVAARGLDIPNVAAVINYSFPLTVEDYVHRIGRTGRGGRSGTSITFFTGENHERALAGELMRVLRDSGFEAEGLKKFPMTVKKKEHSAYGAWFKEAGPEPVAATKIKFT